MSLFQRVPDGRFVRDMVLYGYPERGFISKGYRVITPYLSGMNAYIKNEYHERLRNVLKFIKASIRLQIQWSCDGNYKRELLAYYNKTKETQNEYIREQRDKRYCYFMEKAERNELRREELILFPIIAIKNGSNFFKTSEKQGIVNERIFDQASERLNELGNIIRASLGEDCVVEKLGEEELYTYNKKFFNPHLSKIDYRYNEIDNKKTVIENCLNSEVAKHGTCLLMGGYYHSILSFNRWPTITYPIISERLTHLNMQDYRLTVNIIPRNKQDLINKEKKRLKRIQNERDAKRQDVDLDVSIEKKTKKIQDLKSGDLRPYDVEYIIRLWDDTEKGLKEKEQQIILGMSEMDGAEPFISSLYSTQKKMFFLTFPGYTSDEYRHRRVYAQDDYLSDLIPFSSTFTGDLKDAEALYDGDQNNIVGMRSFVHNTPQHAVLFGMTGAGKSVHMQDFLCQSAPYYKYTAIIDDGLSYKDFSERMGAKPIVIHPSGELTINYFDTRGLPLTSDHLAFVTTLVSNLIGFDSESQYKLRSAQLNEYIQRTYDSALRDWELKNLEKLPELKRMTYATHLWHKKMQEDGSTYLDAFLDLGEKLKKQSEEIIDWYNHLKEEEIVDFSTDQKTKNLYRNICFSYFDKTEFPTHTNLIETIKGHQIDRHNKQDVLDLATLLMSWGKEGQYGKLFDGVSNINLNAEVVHFELQKIPHGLEAMKVACGLLITGVVRQHIISMPRGLRKRIIFEEVANFLNIPFGEKIVGEAYAQLRKYSCQAISIVQQYSQFKNAKIRPVVIGNSKQYWIMKQRDRSDLEDMSKDIRLSESMQKGVQNFVLPEHQSSETRHSSICYYSPESKPALCGVVKNFQL